MAGFLVIIRILELGFIMRLILIMYCVYKKVMLELLLIKYFSLENMQVL